MDAVLLGWGPGCVGGWDTLGLRGHGLGTGDRGRCLAWDAAGEHPVPEPVWVLHLHLGLQLHRGWGGPVGRFLREGTFPTGFNAEH